MSQETSRLKWSIEEPLNMKIYNETRRNLKKHKYNVTKKIGQGSSGTVFLVKHENGQSYTVKEMNTSQTTMENIMKEVKLLKELKHQYVISHIENFSDDEGKLVYVVMEYCKGNLFSVMETMSEQHKVFSEQQIQDWLVQICLALQYIHKNNIIHRDIKPQNILLTVEGYINVGDIGSAKKLGGNVSATSVVGSEMYVSPEVLRKCGSLKSDIWSLGWLLHDLCMLDVWSDEVERRILHSLGMTGRPPVISNRYSTGLQKLVKEMIQTDSASRPSASQILAKPFLRDAVERNATRETRLMNFMTSLRSFTRAYDNHFKAFTAFVDEWKETADEMESVHYSSTAGSLSGAVMGTAGGITTLVGLVLAPFTLGASLIVSGIGIGVGVAGGVTGAASNLAGGVQKKNIQEKIERIHKSYETESAPILQAMVDLEKSAKLLQKFQGLDSDSLQLQLRKLLFYNTNPMHGAAMFGVANVGRIAVQSIRAGRAAMTAMTAVAGVLSALMIAVDVGFIVSDAREIHEMRTQNQINDPDLVNSQVLKLVIQMRNAHKELCTILREIQETKERYKGI